MRTRLWLEVWIEDLSDPPYLMLLTHYSDGAYVITNPQDKSFVLSFKDLEDARLWLLEDEYVGVHGRIEF